MALRNFKPKTDFILAGDETVTIRGLTLNDASLLMEAHWPSMRTVYAEFVKDGEEDGKIDRAIIESIRLAPDLVAAIIACAAGEPDQVETAKSLPFTVQVDALVKIMTLTLSEVGGLGNFLAVLRRAADAGKAAIETAKVAPPASMPDPLANTH